MKDEGAPWGRTELVGGAAGKWASEGVVMKGDARMIIDGFTVFGSWPGLPHERTVETLLAGLKKHKVDRACAMATEGIFLSAAEGNRATWETCAADERLIPIGTADPRRGGAEEVAACKEQGFPIMALFPRGQEWGFTNTAARATLAAISEAGLPVLIEAGRDGDASEVLRATEGLDIPVMLLAVSPHTVAEVIEVLRVRESMYVSTRLLCGGDTIQLIARAVGAERMIYSSRFSVSAFSSAFLTAKFAEISDAERAQIMGGNLARLLGLSA